MDSRQNLYYAFGQIAYALAAADGTIQKEEKQKLHELITAGMKDHQLEFDFSETIFLLLSKEHTELETAYNWGIRQFKLSSQYFSEKMKSDFTTVLEKIAEAFPPSTLDEKELIARFRKDIAGIKGDPVFTGEK